jgi:LemA protein
LTKVVEARARATQITVSADMVNDPEAMKKFAAAQREMSGSLSRLLAVAENYPNLKSDALFRDLTAQLEGTENRITVARNRYIKSIQGYNNAVVSFPTNLTAMIFGFKKKEQFTVENEAEIKQAPKVDFNKPAPAAPAPKQ